VGIEPDRLVVILDGADKLFLATMDDPPIVIRDGNMWSELDSSIIVLDSAVEVTVIGICIATIIEANVERNGDLVTVRYRDYPDFPPQLRHRSFVALISPPAT
jgi:hypothetical protein